MLIIFYWVLVIAGGAYFILTFVVGELVDFGGDALHGVGDTIGGFFESTGDALGGISDAAEVEITLPEVGDAGFDVDSGPSPFGFRTIAMFASGFGAGGLTGTGLGLSEPWTLVPAFGFGLVAGVLTWQFLRFFYREQASTSIQPADYVGLIGRVITSIPEGRLGQVTLDVKLQKKNLPARSEDDGAIASQTQVQVVSMEGGTLIVKKLE